MMDDVGELIARIDPYIEAHPAIRNIVAGRSRVIGVGVELISDDGIGG